MSDKFSAKSREYTLEEIANQFGMTKQKVRQLERTALKKLLL
jgi:DNA-directed RNA polymerase sigma subunit (sigma70/sigma32)